MSTEVSKKAIAVIAEYKEVDESSISLDTKLKDLEMDSLDALNLIFELEEEFDLSFPDEAIPDEKSLETGTIGDLVAGLEKLVAEKEASGSEEE